MKVHERKKPLTCESCDGICNLKCKSSKADSLKILAVNVQGLENKHLQVHNLLCKYNTSVAILSEVETTHGQAATANMQGFRVFCPPTVVTGPPNKEVGVVMMVSNDLAASAKPRYDINYTDTVQTVWTEFVDLKLIVGGVYRRCRPGQPELERTELDQLASQVLRAAHTGLKVLIIGDTNMDHTNSSHRCAFEAEEFLQYIEAGGMKHHPTGPTWQSHGLYKNCSCLDTYFLCPRTHRTSAIDNVFYSIDTYP